MHLLAKKKKEYREKRKKIGEKIEEDRWRKICRNSTQNPIFCSKFNQISIFLHLNLIPKNRLGKANAHREEERKAPAPDPDAKPNIDDEMREMRRREVEEKIITKNIFTY